MSSKYISIKRIKCNRSVAKTIESKIAEKFVTQKLIKPSQIFTSKMCVCFQTFYFRLAYTYYFCVCKITKKFNTRKFIKPSQIFISKTCVCFQTFCFRLAYFYYFVQNYRKNCHAKIYQTESNLHIKSVCLLSLFYFRLAYT